MKTITKNIYQFNELSEEAKKKAVKDYLDELDDYHFLPDDMDYKAGELLEEKGLEVVGDYKVYYSLSHCQGDGAMIEGMFIWGDWFVKVKHSGHYCHERSTSIELWKDEGEITVDAEKEDYTKFEEEVYIPMCKELARYGYDCIDTFRAFDNIADILEGNEYWFTEDGEITEDSE